MLQRFAIPVKRRCKPLITGAHANRLKNNSQLSQQCNHSDQKISLNYGEQITVSNSFSLMNYLIMIYRYRAY